MFGDKTRRTWTSATDSFLSEMLRAILKEMVGSDVYLTQTAFVAQKTRKPNEFEKKDDQFANLVLEVEATTFFTSLSMPRPRGSEGTMPLLPKATAKLVLHNEAAGWYSWKLTSAEVDVEQVFPSINRQCLSFLGHNDWFTPASENLCTLAKELQFRGPSRLKEDQ